MEHVSRAVSYRRLPDKSIVPNDEKVRNMIGLPSILPSISSPCAEPFPRAPGGPGYQGYRPIAEVFQSTKGENSTKSRRDSLQGNLCECSPGCEVLAVPTVFLEWRRTVPARCRGRLNSLWRILCMMSAGVNGLAHPCRVPQLASSVRFLILTSYTQRTLVGRYGCC